MRSQETSWVVAEALKMPARAVKMFVGTEMRVEPESSVTATGKLLVGRMAKLPLAVLMVVEVQGIEKASLAIGAVRRAEG